MFLKLENTLLNTDKILLVEINRVYVKCGKEWYDEDEVKDAGIKVWLSEELFTIYENVSLDEFYKLLELK